jgi:Domain of Unknown Function with PDB structure (DUF3857)
MSFTTSAVSFRAILSFVFTLLTATSLLGWAPTAASIEWKPVTQDEMKLTAVEGAPSASAVCLFSEVFTDDVAGREHHYVRIKVLTQEGSSQGDLAIPYIKGIWDLANLHLRTVQPNGALAEDPATPIDNVILRYRRFRTSAKTLAIPDVQPGTIIEYQYDMTWDNHSLYFDPWVVKGGLFTVRASFARRPSRSLNLRWVGLRLPKGVHVDVAQDGLIRLELKNVPASMAEDFMPPEAETRPRVDFYYYGGRTFGSDTNAAWANVAKSAGEGVEKYLSQDKGVERLITETVKPDDSPEVRIRKLYDRVQGMRSLSFEDEKTRAQAKRENLKRAESVSDVLKNGYGWHGELDLLFLASLKRMGFNAWLLDVARRDGEVFFVPDSMSLSDLPARAVLVNLNGKEYFLDPATPLLPFGWLPWGETSVKALRLDPVSGGLITTPATRAADSAVERRAQLKLDESGGLEGTVTITYSGLEAFGRRFDARSLDDLAKRESLEKELQKWIPRASEATLENQPVWSRPDPTLTAEFHVKIKDWATPVSQRLLCPEGVFSAADHSSFQSDTRVHDLYFPFPSETRDVISLSIPDQYHVDALPRAKSRDLVFLSYTTAVRSAGSAVEISRTVTLGNINLPASVYGGVRAFYQDLQLADESSIVFSAGKQISSIRSRPSANIPLPSKSSATSPPKSRST